MFSEDELLRLLESAVQDGPDDARTAEEWAEIAGVSRPTMRKRLKALKDVGRIECVKVRRERLNGVIAPMDAYRLKEEAPA